MSSDERTDDLDALVAAMLDRPQAADPALWLKIEIELVEESPSSSDQPIRQVELDVNRFHLRKSSDVHIEAVEPTAITHDAEELSITAGVEEELSEELQEQTTSIRAEQLAIEELWRAGKLTAEAGANLIDALLAAYSAAASGLHAAVEAYDSFVLEQHARFLRTWAGLHPDARTLIITVAAAALVKVLYLSG